MIPRTYWKFLVGWCASLLSAMPCGYRLRSNSPFLADVYPQPPASESVTMITVFFVFCAGFLAAALYIRLYRIRTPRVKWHRDIEAAEFAFWGLGIGSVAWFLVFAWVPLSYLGTLVPWMMLAVSAIVLIDVITNQRTLAHSQRTEGVGSPWNTNFLPPQPDSESGHPRPENGSATGSPVQSASSEK